MAVIVRTKESRPSRDPEVRPTPSRPRRRHVEAPDQGELDPRYQEVLTTREDRPVEAPDAGEGEADHGRSQS
jgi:hypothetical protein